VGGNGTGKSTLMKGPGRLDTFDYGSLVISQGTPRIFTAGWPYRFLDAPSSPEWHVSVRRSPCHGERTRSAHPKIADLDHTSPEYADVADRYHRIEHEFQTRVATPLKPKSEEF